MIQTTAIMGEIYDRISDLAFKSVQCGRIRELVSAAQMPACDIGGGSASCIQRAGYQEWSAPIVIVIRTQSSANRRAASDDARDLASQVVDALAGTKGTYYDVFRDFQVTTSDEDEAGTGKTIHIAVVQLTARKG